MIFGLYSWFTVFSLIVTSIKSAAVLYMVNKEDKDFKKRMDDRSDKEKIFHTAKSLLKSFIPIYNVIHPLTMLFKGREDLVSDWKNKCLKRMKKVKNKAQVEKTNVTKSTTQPENKKTSAVDIKRNHTPELPVRKNNTVTTTRPVTNTQNSIDVTFQNKCRNDYEELQKRYEMLKSKKASKKVLDELESKIHAIASAYMDYNSGKSVDELLSSYKREYNKLLEEYNSKIKKSISSCEPLRKRVNEYAIKYNYVHQYKKSRADANSVSRRVLK